MGRLSGLRIVVTRAASQAEELARPLREAGAEVILLPAIAIAPPADPTALEAAARSLQHYDWLLLTSGNAVECFLPLVELPPHSTRPKLGVVGKSTQARAAAFGWQADLLPTDFTAEGLAAAFDGFPVTGLRFLMPGGDLARETLPQRLRTRGAVVDEIEAYRTVMPVEAAEHARLLFSMGPRPDWVTLASPSAIENLVSAVGAESLRHVPLASIGPSTSAAIRALGLTVAAEAGEHTLAGLVEAITG